jgi:hypothetical protein
LPRARPAGMESRCMTQATTPGGTRVLWRNSLSGKIAAIVERLPARDNTRLRREGLAVLRRALTQLRRDPGAPSTCWSSTSKSASSTRRNAIPHLQGCCATRSRAYETPPYEGGPTILQRYAAGPWLEPLSKTLRMSPERRLCGMVRPRALAVYACRPSRSVEPTTR